jgi:CheY-like chemotaxis protein
MFTRTRLPCSLDNVTNSWDRAVATARDKSNGHKIKQTLERSDDSSNAEGRQNHVSPDARAFSVGSPRAWFYVNARVRTSPSVAPHHRSDSQTPALELFNAAASSLLDRPRQVRPKLQNLETKLEQTPLISIVDDDEAVREATKSLIRSLGYNAETFGSAEEFLAWTQIEDTDCLITDVQMPGLSGMDLQDRLISAGHEMPTIFVTAFPDAKLERRALRGGAIAYLRKPIEESHLLEHIDTALRRRRS